MVGAGFYAFSSISNRIVYKIPTGYNCATWLKEMRLNRCHWGHNWKTGVFCRCRCNGRPSMASSTFIVAKGKSPADSEPKYAGLAIIEKLLLLLLVVMVGCRSSFQGKETHCAKHCGKPNLILFANWAHLV